MKPAALSFLVALGLAAIVTLALVISACRSPSDSCYIMQGMAFYFAPVVLLVLWPIAYGGVLIVRLIRNPPKY